MRTTRLSNASRKAAFTRCLEALSKLGYEVMDKDLIAGTIVAQKQLSPIAFARELFVELFPSGETGVRVNAQVRSIAIQLGNWDQNKEREEEFLDAVRELEATTA